MSTSRPTRNWRSAGGATLRIAFAALFAAPLIWMLSASLKPDAAIHRDIDSLASFAPVPVTLDNYRRAVSSPFATVLTNSAAQVLAVAALGAFFNSLAAYAFARMRVPGGEWIFIALVATIIVPLEAIVIPLFLLWRDAVGDRTWTLAALIVPFSAKAFNIFLLRQSFLALPRALEEAAFLDGASWFRVYARIALPNVIPALVTVMLLDIVLHWNDFLWPLVISLQEDTRTLQLGLENFYTQPPISWGAILAYAVLATAPVAIVFTLGQRFIAQSFLGSSVRA